MIKVMLVDDEMNLYPGIKKMIEKIDKEFQVVSFAQDGEEALEMLRNHDIDVVISDIEMPVIDGITLISEIKKRYPQIQKVVLSAYPNFEYAQKVMETGVHHYLLKPPTESKIKSLLDELKSEYNVDKYRKTKLELRKCINKNKLINKNYALGEGYISIFLLCAGSWSLRPIDVMSDSVVFLDEYSIDNPNVYVDYDIKNTFIFPGRQLNERIIIIRHKEKLVKPVSLSNNILHDAIEHKMPLTLVHSLNNNYSEYIISIIRDLRSMLIDESLFEKSSQIALDLEYKSKSIKVERFIKDRIYSKEQLLECLHNTFNNCSKENTTQYDVISLIRQIFFDQRVSVGLDNQVIDKYIENVVCDVHNYSDLEKNIKLLIEEELTKKNGNKKNIDLYHLNAINDIKKYLNEHSNEKITLNKLSKEFGLVPNYLSNMFKKYAGMTPGEYLLEIRMKEAGRLLREDQQILVKEVAIKVGYSDPLYFSKTFKKYYGKSPNEFISSV